MRPDEERRGDHAEHHQQRDPLERIADSLEELLRSEVMRRLQRIETKLNQVLHMEVEHMAIGQDILTKVAANSTLIGSVKTLVQGLIDNHTIPAAEGAAIIAALSGNQTELQAIEAALLTNTPTPPPPPTP